MLKTISTPPASLFSEISALRTYIKKHWHALKRSNEDSLQKSTKDSKIEDNNRQLLYIPSKEDKRKACEQFPAADVRILPEDYKNIGEHGLLYLPYPYLVPGGRFNEMYGWDSYFILIGLLRDGEYDLAKNIVDNFVYQIEHYGKILNANRTYYLTRSQPPFFTRMVMELYPHLQDPEWLSKCLVASERYYQLWLKDPHLDSVTGLSRYYGTGSGPCIEVLSEKDEKGLTHYERVKEYFKTHVSRAQYSTEAFYNAEKDELTEDFYLGDRAMRESGFDPSDRFGPFNADCHHYAPVCLNSLLHQMEKDMLEMCSTLKDHARAKAWKEKADKRKEIINTLLWSAQSNLYFDYNIVTKNLRSYPFITAFYPLWVKIATPEQAQAVVETALPLLEAKGGLQTSLHDTGCQWDAPYGWAPMQLIACKGMMNYGFEKEATRIATKFVQTVLESFNQKGRIFEKYDLRGLSAETHTEFGYVSNEIGFGWTNGVVNEFLDVIMKDTQHLK